MQYEEYFSSLFVFRNISRAEGEWNMENKKTRKIFPYCTITSLSLAKNVKVQINMISENWALLRKTYKYTKFLSALYWLQTSNPWIYYSLDLEVTNSRDQCSQFSLILWRWKAGLKTFDMQCTKQSIILTSKFVLFWLDIFSRLDDHVLTLYT